MRSCVLCVCVYCVLSIVEVEGQHPKKSAVLTHGDMLKRAESLAQRFVLVGCNFWYPALQLLCADGVVLFVAVYQ